MDEKMVSLRINDIPVTVPEGSTVLEAARSAGFNIPSLCFLKDINEIGACRICVVEVKGAKSLVASCVYPVAEGMEVYTNTERVRKSRQLTLELILSNHRMDCLTCSRNSHCELLQLAGDLGIDAVRYANDNMPPQIEASAPHLVRDNSKCVLCRRCTAVCRKTQEVGVIGPNDRGFHTHIGCAFDRDLAEVDCVSCGQCIVACPTGALSEKDDTARVLAALNDPAKHVVVGPAPSIRVTLGECFGLPIGTNVEGKMVTALRRLGFDKVFDVDTAADFTILEEGTEFLSRLNGGGNLPLITSCSPGWVRYLEQHAPDMIRNISSCKSPQQMFGSLVKTYYAEQAGIDPQDIFVVSIMPCTAKKYEVLREEQRLPNGCMPVDVSLTTRELGRMITQAGLLFEHLPDGAFDPMLGVSTGAASWRPPCAPWWSSSPARAWPLWSTKRSAAWRESRRPATSCPAKPSGSAWPPACTTSSGCWTASGTAPSSTTLWSSWPAPAAASTAAASPSSTPTCATSPTSRPSGPPPSTGRMRA